MLFGALSTLRRFGQALQTTKPSDANAETPDYSLKSTGKQRYSSLGVKIAARRIRPGAQDVEGEVEPELSSDFEEDGSTGVIDDDLASSKLQNGHYSARRALTSTGGGRELPHLQLSDDLDDTITGSPPDNALDLTSDEEYSWAGGAVPMLDASDLIYISTDITVIAALTCVQQEGSFPVETGHLHRSIEWTIAGVLALARRADLDTSELTPEAFLTLLWILHLFDNQYYSCLSDITFRFTRLHPSPKNAADALRPAMLSLQSELLQRCDWRVKLDVIEDLSPALHDLQADSSFQDVLDHLRNEAQRVEPLEKPFPSFPYARAYSPVDDRPLRSDYSHQDLSGFVASSFYTPLCAANGRQLLGGEQYDYRRQANQGKPPEPEDAGAARDAMKTGDRGPILGKKRRLDALNENSFCSNGDGLAAKKQQAGDLFAPFAAPSAAEGGFMGFARPRLASLMKYGQQRRWL